MDKKSKFIALVGQFNGEPCVAAAATGNCPYVTTAVISDIAAGGALTVAAQPDYPRTLRVHLVNAAGTNLVGTVTVVGIDQNGNGITDIIIFSGATHSVDGVKAFAKITSATYALTSGTVTTTDDTIALGPGPAIGLPAAPGAIYDRLIKAAFDDADDLGTFSKTYGIYTPAGTMDDAKHLEVLFLFELGIDVY